MTFWLYDPKKLASIGSLVPYKQKDFGDIFNFLTYLCMFVYVYLYKTNNLEKYKYILISSFVVISFLGVISKDKIDNKDNTKLFDWGDYNNTLSID